MREQEWSGTYSPTIIQHFLQFIVYTRLHHIVGSPGRVSLLLLPVGAVVDDVGGEVLLHGRAGADQVLVPEAVVYPADTGPELGVRPDEGCGEGCLLPGVGPVPV